MLGDPYGSVLECGEVVGVEEHSTGEEVGTEALRGKPRRLVVHPREGEVLLGRWVAGRREGPGTASGPWLEKVPSHVVFHCQLLPLS